MLKCDHLSVWVVSLRVTAVVFSLYFLDGSQDHVLRPQEPVGKRARYLTRADVRDPWQMLFFAPFAVPYPRCKMPGLLLRRYTRRTLRF